MKKSIICSVCATGCISLAIVFSQCSMDSFFVFKDQNKFLLMKFLSTTSHNNMSNSPALPYDLQYKSSFQPEINKYWPSCRSIQRLSRDQKNDESPTKYSTIVDNFWRLYHEPLNSNNWSDHDLNILGTFGFEIAQNISAPPLPTCWPRNEEKHLSHVLLDSVKSFAHYDLSETVTNGGDNQYLQEISQGFFPKTETSFLTLPVILWHRIMFQAAMDGYDMFPCIAQSSNQTCSHHFVSMTETGRIHFCLQKNDYSPDLEPELTCIGEKRSPAITYPYCNRETAPVAIISVDCLIAESGFAVSVIIWNLISISAGGRVLSYNKFPGRWQIPKNVPVIEYDELACAGTSVYPSEPGHFFNEILPRLVHMDATLPSHIPLLWPDGALPERILTEFRTKGLISSHRLYVPTQAPSLHRARRMYVFASDYGAEHTPLLTLLGHATLQARIHAYVSARTSMVHNGVVVLTRGQSGRARSIANQQDLLAALENSLPGVTIDAFEPTSSLLFLEVARRVYEARVIIGPHGANLNNIMGARPGTYVIELGYAGGMMMPSDFFCLARNLGLNYWLSPSVSGNYGSVLHVNVADVIKIVKTVF